MNKKDFVTFEQAKKLKELGFKEKCVYHYYKTFLDSNGCDYITQDVDSSWESYNTKENYPLEYIDAPFLYQVLEWLREEKKIHISIDTYFLPGEEGDKYYYWYNCVNGTGKVLDPDDNTYDSYHEVLNVAIDYVLKGLVN